MYEVLKDKIMVLSLKDRIMIIATILSMFILTKNGTSKEAKRNYLFCIQLTEFLYASINDPLQ